LFFLFGEEICFTFVLMVHLKYPIKKLFIPLAFLFLACNSKTESAADTDVVTSGGTATGIATAVATESNNAGLSKTPVDVHAIAILDSSGKTKGWGYELFQNGKRIISQPVIPAMQGNHYFASEELAKKVGLFAAKKMEKSGGLPALSLKELDSLGVKGPAAIH